MHRQYVFGNFYKNYKLIRIIISISFSVAMWINTHFYPYWKTKDMSMIHTIIPPLHTYIYTYYTKVSQTRPNERQRNVCIGKLHVGLLTIVNNLINSIPKVCVIHGVMQKEIRATHLGSRKYSIRNYLTAS